MSIYSSYPLLIESTLYDAFIYQKIIQAKWFLFLLCLVSGPIGSLFPVIGILCRSHISDIYIRRFLSWSMIIWSYFSGMSIWFLLLLIIEVIREFLRFGVPWIFTRISQNLPENAAAETLSRRLFKLLQVIHRQPIILSGQQLMLYCINYGQGDVSEKFTSDEKLRFGKFFREFSSTCFILESDAITIFFPSFVIRVTSDGIQFTSDDAIKLVRYEKTDDICAICRGPFEELSVRLKCKHRYCLKCIFMWFTRQYICPTCRAIVN